MIVKNAEDNYQETIKVPMFILEGLSKVLPETGLSSLAAKGIDLKEIIAAGKNSVNFMKTIDVVEKNVEKKIRLSILCFAVLLCSVVGGTGGSLAEEQGAFEGQISFGGILINSGNNLNPEGSEKRIDDLNSAADKELTVLPIVLPDLTYDVGTAEGLKVYFETNPPIDEVGGFAFNLGATYQIPEIGIIDGSVFFTPFEEAWEDPYVTGVDRKETDTTKYGAKIGLNRIMGTGLRINFVYLNDDVDNDLIGSLEHDLNRDGAVYSLNMNYSFYPSKTLELRPRISFRKGDYDGDANSFTKYKFELETRYMVGQVMVMPRAYYSYSKYDEVNPIFNKERDNDSYGLSLIANYMAPFNYQNWSITGLLSLSRGDSNIEFYDTEAVTLGGFLNYHF